MYTSSLMSYDTVLIPSRGSPLLSHLRRGWGGTCDGDGRGYLFLPVDLEQKGAGSPCVLWLRTLAVGSSTQGSSEIPSAPLSPGDPLAWARSGHSPVLNGPCDSCSALGHPASHPALLQISLLPSFPRHPDPRPMQPHCTDSPRPHACSPGLNNVPTNLHLPRTPECDFIWS